MRGGRALRFHSVGLLFGNLLLREILSHLVPELQFFGETLDVEMFGSHLRSPYDFHLIEQSSPPPVLLEVHLEGGGGLVGSACPLEVLQTVFDRVWRDIGCQMRPGTGGFHLSQIDDIHQFLGLHGMRQAAFIAQLDHVVSVPRYVSRMIASSSLQPSPVVASSVFVGHLVRLTPVHYAV